MDIGTRLRRRRESLGLTSQDVARTCGVDASVVEGWEVNLYMPTAPAAHRLARMLALTMEQVYGFEPFPIETPPPPAIDGARLHAQLDRMIGLLEART